MFKVKKGPPTGKTVRSIDIQDGVLFFGGIRSRRADWQANGLFYKKNGAIVRINSPWTCDWWDATPNLLVEDYMPILKVEMEE